MAKRAVLAFAIMLVIAWPPRGGHAEVLSAHDLSVGKAMFKALKAKRWKRAEREAARITDPLLRKIARWLDDTRANTRASFSDIARFMADNPSWPRQDLLQRRAEESMTEATPAEEILGWFGKRKPLTSDGWIRYGAALLAAGEKEKARAVLRRTWIRVNFGKRQERQFYRRYRKFLTAEDHVSRLDRLLWEGRYWSSRRMFRRVDAAFRALAEARLLLRYRRGNVDGAIARVPKALKDHPGLVYERVRWRRRKGRYLDAAELFDGFSGDVPHAKLWWQERAILARRLLQKGYLTQAYRLASDHGLRGGAEFAEAEWLAGWIALRFLDDPPTASAHFKRMYGAVKYPVSLARGAYWTARAAEAMNDRGEAERWYRIAARHATTYYGELAAARLDPDGGLELPPEPSPTATEAAAFQRNELARAVRMLAELGRDRLVETFLSALGDAKREPGWRVLTADLAQEVGRPDLSIRIAERSSRAGQVLIEAGYPTLPLIPLVKESGNSALEVPLVLAMVRQESAFDVGAKSQAGARGLMQLMPRTAHRVAKTLRVPYSRKKLVSDPHYNLRLGQAHVADLMAKFDGSYVLALAAYNAGPKRARKWLRDNGNPGPDADAAIDWIEMIPFDETRNYVQRVLENLQVYRLRLAVTEVAQSLHGDLLRKNDGSGDGETGEQE